MIIRELKLKWFRGAADEAVLDCGGKSAVIYGTNGAGKSSFVDGIEFLLSDGRIRHLAHEYSGQKQERGIRNTHSPDGAGAEVLIAFADGSRIRGVLPESGDFETESSSADLQDTVDEWQLEHFVLRQDEVAAFIHATKGEKYSVLLPLLGLHEIEQSASNLRELARVFEARSRLANRVQDLEHLKTQASDSLVKLTIKHASSVLQGLADEYLDEGAPKSFDSLLKALEAKIDERIENAEPAQKLHHQLSQIDDADLKTKLDRLSEAEGRASKSHSGLIDRQISVLEATSKFIDALIPDQTAVACPACGRELPVKDLGRHVDDELQNLRDARTMRDAAIQARKDFLGSIGALQTGLKAPEFTEWIKESKRKKLRSGIREVVDLKIKDTTAKWSDESWAVLHGQIPLIARQIATASKKTPATTQKLIDAEKSVAACRLIPKVNANKKKISDIEKVLGALKKAEQAIRSEIKTKTEAVIGQISSEVQALWLKLHPNEPIQDIRLYIPGDADKAIDIGLKFFGVEQPSPRLSLSESHRNSLGLCIFLALATQDNKVIHPIVLDDVVSSFDRDHRGMVGDLLLEDLSSRQILVFTHDREWYTELRWRLPAAEWEFRVLKPWSEPRIGIQWAHSADTFAAARALVSTDPEAAGNRVRAIMDTQTSIIAEKLRIPMPYLRGDRNDRRTCIELLEKIISEGQGHLKHRINGGYEAYGAPLAKWKQAWTLLGAWANRASHTGSLVEAEVEKLAGACEAALSEFRCPDCEDPLWIGDQSSRERLQCSCGRLRWQYG